MEFTSFGSRLNVDGSGGIGGVERVVDEPTMVFEGSLMAENG